VEEVDQLPRPLQPGQVAMQDDPIQARVAELDALPKHPGQSVDGTPPSANDPGFDTLDHRSVGESRRLILGLSGSPG